MTDLIFGGRLVSNTGKPISGIEGLLRVYSTESGGWTSVGKVSPNARGEFDGRVDLDQFVPQRTFPLLSIAFGDRVVPTAVDAKHTRSTVTAAFGDVVVGSPTDPTDPTGPTGDPAALKHVEIDSLITGLGGRLTAAHKTLGESSEGRMRIGNVKVQVRGVVGNDGLGIALNLPDATAAAGSLLEFEYEHDREDEQSTVTRVVPALLGTTETLARRVLSSVGLRLVHSTKTASPGEVSGQCVVQSPEAGAEVAVGTEVLVVFASANPNEGAGQ